MSARALGILVCVVGLMGGCPLAFAQGSFPVCDAGGPYGAVPNVPLQFDGTGSESPGSTIVSYEWNFGDGGTGSGPEPVHTYTDYGTYSVTLVVTEDDGAETLCSTTVFAFDETGPPVCDAGGPYRVSSGVPLRFDGSGSNAADGPIVAYAWLFGDGDGAEGARPWHTYTSAGFYTVTLTVTDDDGNASACTSEAFVTDEVIPHCDAGRRYTGTVGVPTQFDGSDSRALDAEITAFDWEFGDGAVGTGPLPTHTYQTFGIYTVTLVVTTEFGDTAACNTIALISAVPVEPTTWGLIKAVYREVGR